MPEFNLFTTFVLDCTCRNWSCHTQILLLQIEILISSHKRTRDSHHSCWVKNVYLLTGREGRHRVPHPAGNCSIHHGALHSQAKSSMLFSAHIWFPPATRWQRILLSYNGERERKGEGESECRHTFLHTSPSAHALSRQWNPQRKPTRPYKQAWTHTPAHAYTRWPLRLPPQGCHWSSNTAEHQSVCDCLLVSFFFFPLAFCPHPLNLSSAPWVFLQTPALSNWACRA